MGGVRRPPRFVDESDSFTITYIPINRKPVHHFPVSLSAERWLGVLQPAVDENLVGHLMPPTIVGMDGHGNGRCHSLLYEIGIGVTEC